MAHARPRLHCRGPARDTHLRGQLGLEILSNIFSNDFVRHALGAHSYVNVATELYAGWESTFGPAPGVD